MMDRQDAANTEGARIVYVRPVQLADLPEEIQVQAPPGLERIYAVHDQDGQRLALVKDRALAFVLAEQNDMDAVSVH